MNTRNLLLPAIIVACAATPAHAQTEENSAPGEDVILSTSTFEIVHVSPELSEILEKGRRPSRKPYPNQSSPFARPTTSSCSQSAV